jgi:hypothetical protein
VNLGFVILGGIALVVGTLMMALPGPIGRLFGIADEELAGKALLIAGMMTAAFGLILAGFAIAYATAEPLAEPAR